MGGRLIGQIAWGLLGLIGLFSVVDLGFGPIVICPMCSIGLKTAVGVILILVSVAAFVMNRAGAQR